MSKKIQMSALALTAALGASFFTPSVASAATVSATPAVQLVASSVQPSGQIRVKTFWSALIRVFITISGHAAKRMAERNVSQALLKQILNDGSRTPERRSCGPSGRCHGSGER